MRRFALILILWPGIAFAGNSKPCVPVAQAPNYLNKDICIAAHIYEIVQLPDGTRFMDVCPPETTDAECRFTIVSLRRDRGDVGELDQYRATDVNIRGMWSRCMAGRKWLSATCGSFTEDLRSSSPTHGS